MHYRNHLSPPLFPTTWATTWGEDHFGLWMSLEYKGAGLTFRWILPGTFMMGSQGGEKGRYGDEDLHEVTLEQGFWLSDTPVTQAFWLAVTGENPSKFKGDELPIETVSWDESQSFINSLNRLHPDLTTRLPWEAEWEYACRAGTATPFSFEGGIDSTKANYRGVWEVKDIKSYENNKEWGNEALRQTSAMKSYPANLWGLYDMHGNVWEWCQDQWQENLGTESTVFNVLSEEKNKHSSKNLDDLQSAEESDEKKGQRVVRGGSWHYRGGYCRSACRNRYTPDDRNDFVGFRLALGH